MSDAISESRFNMWRAVVAMVHADGVVVKEERDFVENYLSSLPFSEEQKATLREDLETPQSPQEMFAKISEKPDQAEFFQFARMVIWCDGDLDSQEDRIFKLLMKEQIRDLGQDNLRKIAEETRDLERIRRMREDEMFERRAEDLVGLRNIVKKMIGV